MSNKLRPNLNTFMSIGTLFLGNDSLGGIDSAVELIPLWEERHSFRSKHDHSGKAK